MFIKRFWFPGIILVLLFVNSAYAAYGYQRITCPANPNTFIFWSKADIPIKFWISNQCNTKEKKAIRQAFNTWGSVKNSKLRFIEVSTESQAKIKLIKNTLLSTSAETDFGTPPACSELDGHITNIVTITFSSNLCWFQDKKTKIFCNLNPLNTDLDTYSVTLHEIGHAALGLQHPFGDIFPGPNRVSVVEPVDENEILTNLFQDDITAAQNIYPSNRPPIANAGPDQTVQVGLPVQLDGSGFDPDGDPIKSYRWNILPRENSAQCVFKSSRNIAQPTIQPRREGSCTIELVVSDGKLTSVPDQVTITARKEVCKFKREIYWIGQPPEGVSQTLIDPPTPPADASVRFSLCVEETQDGFRWVYTVYNLDFRTQEGINGLSGVRIENKFSVPFSNQFGPPGWVMQGFTSEWEWDIPSGQGIPKGGSAQFGFVTAKDVGPTQSDCCYWVHSWDSVPLQVDVLDGGQMLIPGPLAAAASQTASTVGVSSIEREYSFGLMRGSLGVKDFSVIIFDLSGKLIFRSDWVQNGFKWNLLDNRGQPLANGVYLYVISVRDFNGAVIRSEVKKLVILR